MDLFSDEWLIDRFVLAKNSTHHQVYREWRDDSQSLEVTIFYRVNSIGVEVKRRIDLEFRLSYFNDVIATQGKAVERVYN